MAAQYVNITTVMKHFLVVFAASLVLTRIESEDIRGVNYPHEIPFLHDYTLYREHDILFTSPVLDFGPPAIHVHVFLNSRIFRGVKPIFRLCPSLGSNQPSPLKLDFGSALFLILLSGQVELNPGPPMSGSLNLSSIFPCGYCEDPVTWEQHGICCDSCDVWFHKDCVDMGSFTFLAYSTTNVSWICCRCNHPNFDRNLFHSFEIETTNNFDNLNFSGSENVNSPNSDFAPTQHSSPIPPFRPKNRQRNWRTLLINCRSLKGKVANFLASVNYYQPDCILGTESWLDKDTTTSEIFPPEYQVLRKDRNLKARGGGVFIAVRKHYDMTLLPDLETNCEILWAEVQISASKSLTLGCFYRPPDSKISTSEELVKSLDLMPKNSNQTIVLGGDFNLPGIDWDNAVVNPKAANKSQCELLLSSLDTHALAQIHKEPTREENILDLLITNKPGLIKSSYSVPGISDHCAVVTELDIDPPYRRTKPRPVRQFKKANWEAIRQQIRSCWTSFSENSPSCSVNENWLKLKSILNQCRTNLYQLK